jgi:choline dehydrogenase-like flavoprotein
MSSSDYVIVGAGAAGSTLARRLLDAGKTVHVLEAGPADVAEEIHSPQGWPLLLADRRTGRSDRAAEAREQPLAVLAAWEGPRWQ